MAIFSRSLLSMVGLVTVVSGAALLAEPQAIDSARALAPDRSRQTANAALPPPLTSGKFWTYAPRAYLHENDGSWPLSPLTFIEHTEYIWFGHDSDCPFYRPQNQTFAVPEAALGSFEWAHQAANDQCTHSGVSYANNVPSAPYEGGSDTPSGGDGWFLDLDNDYRDGQGFQTDEPVIVRNGNSDGFAWVQYWFHYGDSRIPPYNAGHEGDWEHISIRFNEAGTAPTRVEYSFHHEKCTLRWGQVPKLHTVDAPDRPLVWIAKGTHGSYPPLADTYSFGGISDIIDNDERWDTWGNLHKLSDYAFHPYGGGWGQVGYVADTSGPSSPGNWRGSPKFDLNRECKKDDGGSYE